MQCFLQVWTRNPAVHVCQSAYGVKIGELAEKILQGQNFSGVRS